MKLKINLKKIIIFMLSILPFFTWSYISLTIMNPYIGEMGNIVIILVFSLGLILSFCIISNKLITNILSALILILFTSYFIYEGFNNYVFGSLYPVFLVLAWLYYLTLYYLIRRKNDYFTQ